MLPGGRSVIYYQPSRNRRSGTYAQKIIFNPNCICRDGLEVLVIRPAVASGASVGCVPEKTICCGKEKFARLKMLNTSARNCMAPASPRILGLNFLMTLKSLTAKLGPIKTLRPRLPNVPCSGNENAVGL